MAKGLTKKQRLFAEYYLECWNATEAAKRAGYSEDSAGSIGWENLKKPEIVNHIRARARAKESEAVATADEVMSFMSAVVRGNVTDQFGLEASLDTRLKAADGLMKRYTIGADKQEEALNKLDKLIEGIDNAAKS